MYRVETDEQAQQQIDQLPASALAAYVELWTLLEIGPWSGESINEANPDKVSSVRAAGSRCRGSTSGSSCPRRMFCTKACPVLITRAEWSRYRPRIGLSRS